MATTEYSLNGVNVQIEYPDRLIGQPRRAAWGTLVRQPRDTWNWFHLAPTTPVNGVSASGSFQMWLDRVRLDAGCINGLTGGVVALRLRAVTYCSIRVTARAGSCYAEQCLARLRFLSSGGGPWGGLPPIFGPGGVPY